MDDDLAKLKDDFAKYLLVVLALAVFFGLVGRQPTNQEVYNILETYDPYHTPTPTFTSTPTLPPDAIITQR